MSATVNPFVQRNHDCAQFATARGSQYRGPEPEMRDIDDMPLLLTQPIIHPIITHMAWLSRTLSFVLLAPAQEDIDRELDSRYAFTFRTPRLINA